MYPALFLYLTIVVVLGELADRVGDVSFVEKGLKLLEIGGQDGRQVLVPG